VEVFVEDDKKEISMIFLYNGSDKKRFNTRAIFERHNESNLVYLFSKNTDNLLVAKIFRLCFGSLETGRFSKVVDTLITDGPFPTYNPFILFRLRIVMISHAHLVKKQGVHGYRGWKKFFKYLLIRYRSWFTDEYWTTATSQIPKVEKSYLISKRKIKVLKLPKYCLPDYDQHKLLERLGIESTPNKLVLIAPTWRRSRFGNTQAGLDLVLFLNWLKGGRLNALLDNGIHLVIRPHPITSSYLDTSLKNVSVADESLIEIIEPYLSAFDLVISDYSGILADAAFVNVPTLAYIEDIDIFKANKGLYDGTQELLEGIGVDSFRDLYDYLIFNKNVNQDALKKLADFFFDERLESYENQLFYR
jgi:CDP-glycerol glycerophosphotransferase (TagB/SpsB family)